MTEKLGIMICGHGSRNKRAVAQFATLSDNLKTRFPDLPVEYGYLEFANPIINSGLDKLREAGCNRILAVPGMLFAAGHAKNDIPSVLQTYANRHENLTIDYGRELGIDARMIRAAADRIQQGIDAAQNPDFPNQETLLVVVGRGASDPDANGNVAKVMRMLHEGFGFGWAETAYSGVTFPLVEPCLQRVVKLGFKRIIVFPYFLFTGVLVNRIYQAVDRVAGEFPEIEFLKAPYLGDHPLVIDTFKERIDEILTGDNNMNCGMCKYRTQILGFEDQVGLPQESHHHHVEGVGSGCTLCEDECTGACQEVETPSHSHGDHEHHHHDHPHDHAHDNHGHHHHPYPHADHPLGPVTLKGTAKNGNKNP